MLGSQFDDMVKAIRPKDYQLFLGDTYEISGLPDGMCEEGLAEFLRPEYTATRVKGTKRIFWGAFTTRTYWVMTNTKIVWEHKQGANFLASCNVAA